ncbi:carbon storage regulator, CsrA [Pseudothermotoga lettingae TMO]|uniref:Translational regulator CsrA n=1 Tax=Pseudothermotoga lettingae (strain ATCC BAA-301 / DSM 14385 / NBRC 107922 / TMO) TaxID=416591 RepID=CSRA_PSELT|nr:carbon storage regulator CsrA [Pseudothermotoga lettingae]A8F501.1 RecName: Full=Translational regulator CsrA [Pseudothermotoga lettingae TMO]ABV33235.1 carbon storage regulator, CsrA [Pseudothermotoga lettingae TMO]GLI49848.1 carbon storage regulator [Pseudothermotoga lettingae TMO]
MLVISRKSGESFMIGDSIEVKILRIEGSEVKIGISAPSHVKIYRAEIYQKIVKENKMAVQVDIVDLSEVIFLDRNK